MPIVVMEGTGASPATPGSLAVLKARVASELHRSDLTDEIADAITTAINYYRSHRFEFNEQQASFVTVAGTESYGSNVIPDDIGQIDSVRMTVNGRLVVLEPLLFKELQALSTTTNTNGQPSYYAWYASHLFFYPIPDAAYTTLVSYQQREDAPLSDSDTATIWTNQCEALIRHCAKKLLRRDVMQDYEGAQASEAAEAEALGVLKRESIQLQDEGGLAPNW
jgi:hypothetical protein